MIVIFVFQLSIQYIGSLFITCTSINVRKKIQVTIHHSSGLNV